MFLTKDQLLTALHEAPDGAKIFLDDGVDCAAILRARVAFNPAGDDDDISSQANGTLVPDGSVILYV